MATRRKKIQTPEELARTQTAKAKIAARGAKKEITKPVVPIVEPTIAPVEAIVTPVAQPIKSSSSLEGIIDPNTGEIIQENFRRSALTPEQQSDLDIQQGRVRDIKESARLQVEREQLIEDTERSQREDTQATISRSLESLSASRGEAARVRERQEEAVRGAEAFEPGTLTATGNLGVGMGALEGIRIRTASMSRKFNQVAQNLRSAQTNLDAAIKSGDNEKKAEAIAQRMLAEDRARELEIESELQGQESSNQYLDFVDGLSNEGKVSFWGNMTEQDQANAEAQFESAGRPASFVGAMINNAQQQQLVLDELAKSPTEELQNRLAVLQGRAEDIKFETSSETQKALDGIQTLKDAVAGGLDQATADQLAQQLGFSDKPLTTAEQKKADLDNRQLELDNEKKALEIEEAQNALDEDIGTPTYVSDFWKDALSKTSAVAGVTDTPLEKKTPGQDFVLNRGTAVPSNVAGKVLTAEEHPDFGNSVVVEDAQKNLHRYSHLSNMNVEAGSTIAIGQTIGAVGNTGSSYTERGIGDIRADGTTVEVGASDIGQFFPITDVQRAEGRGSHLDYRTTDSEGNFIDPVSFIKSKGLTDIQQTAQDIFSGTSTQRLSDISTKNNRKEKVGHALSVLKTRALKEAEESEQPSAAIIGAMRASAGGSATTQTFESSFEKLATTINQVSVLNDALNQRKIKGKDSDGESVSLAPLTGWIKSNNPWSAEGQEINAILQGTIPNLARGVFGEVGVLTDRDIELYRKTLPNLTQPEDIRKSVTAITMRTLRNSLDNKVRIAAGAGRDVSGLVSFYEEIDSKVRELETDLGIIGGEEEQPEQITEQTPEQEDDTFFTEFETDTITFEEDAEADEIFGN